jgi:hypothetical protein
VRDSLAAKKCRSLHEWLSWRGGRDGCGEFDQDVEQHETRERHFNGLDGATPCEAADRIETVLQGQQGTTLPRRGDQIETLPTRIMELRGLNKGDEAPVEC